MPMAIRFRLEYLNVIIQNILEKHDFYRNTTVVLDEIQKKFLSPFDVINMKIQNVRVIFTYSLFGWPFS